MSPCIDSIQITDEDIDWVESLFTGVTFDVTRRDIIKRLDSFDVQAFPGTGKTTVLVAKLAILAKKWKWTDKGVCVLSHTNVAREEIENRLSKTEIGERLLSHPHFIGTVHSFFDKYVATPRLKSDGYPITLVDTDVALMKRWWSLNKGTINFLERKHRDVFALQSVEYPPKIGDIGCNQESLSYKDAASVLKKSFGKGYFTFEEMLFTAERVFDDSPWISKSLQSRFPVVLIDEAQDTSDLQWNLINAAFPKSGNSVIQLFGDGNQAIYNYSGQTANAKRFPEEPILTISDSRRFGKSISTLADPLAVVHKGLEGVNELFDAYAAKNTIFVFDNISRVLPEFGSHVLNAFPDEVLTNNSADGIHAIGAVHNNDAVDVADKRYPLGIKDYWSSYDASIIRASSETMFLIDYFRNERDNPKAGYLEESYARGLRKLLNITKAGLVPLNYSSVNALSNIANDKLAFRKKLLALTNMKFQTQDEWKLVVEEVKSLCEECFDIQSLWPEFLQWKADTYSESLSNKKAGNIYRYEENGRCVDIEIGSIHSVKGRTHLATLVLDTYWYDRNIPSIFPWLNGEKKKIGTRDAIRLKTHYVALTRAKAMVCIAIPKKAISDAEIELLRSVGWQVKII